MYGKHHSEIARRKMSETKKRLFSSGQLVPHNKKHDKPLPMSKEELKQWRSKRMTGAGNPSYGKGLAVSQYDLSGIKIKAYVTAREAERETGVDHTTIARCCKHKQQTAGGYKWEYGGEDNDCMTS